MPNIVVPVAISPCPNDTFIFESWFLHEIDDGIVTPLPSFFDINSLNQLAIEEAFPIIKISCALFPKIEEKYQLLQTGGAFSNFNGPLVIAKHANLNLKECMQTLTVAVPGLQTSAYTALQLLYGTPKKTVVMAYNEIAEAVAERSDIDAGILIHEMRFTFMNKYKDALFQIMDLGSAFYYTYNSFLPLGCIVAHRSLSTPIIQEVERCIKASISRAFIRKEVVTPFIAAHASDLSCEAIQQHINMYVNQDSIAISQPTYQALLYFFDKSKTLS